MTINGKEAAVTVTVLEVDHSNAHHVINVNSHMNSTIASQKIIVRADNVVIHPVHTTVHIISIVHIVHTFNIVNHINSYKEATQNVVVNKGTVLLIKWYWIKSRRSLTIRIVTEYSNKFEKERITIWCATTLDIFKNAINQAAITQLTSKINRQNTLVHSCQIAVHFWT